MNIHKQNAKVLHIFRHTCGDVLARMLTQFQFWSTLPCYSS